MATRGGGKQKFPINLKLCLKMIENSINDITFSSFHNSSGLLHALTLLTAYLGRGEFIDKNDSWPISAVYIWSCVYAYHAGLKIMKGTVIGANYFATVYKNL